MKIKNLKFIICLLLSAIYYLIFAIDKAEAKALSLGIYPPIIQVQLDPPAIIDRPITIENYGEEIVTLKILFKPFTAVASDATAGKSENGEVAYLWDKKPPLIFQNIKVRENGKATDEIILAPRQKKNLSLHFDIPKDEPLSDYYFSVVFISENTLKDELNQSKIQGGIATNVLLSIKGKPPLIGAKPTSIAKIVEFSSPSLLEIGPVHFTVRLKNQSNHFITPQGTISIKNMFGKTIGKIKLSPLNILAGSIRSQETLWQETLLFGPYTATLNINPSDNLPILVKTVTFFVFPFRAFLILIAMVFGILFIKNRLKRYRKA